MNDLWQYEKEALAAGHTSICGCDEAGAGPLAGPVYAAAVILPLGVEIDGLNDSKKLTEKKREALFPVIQEKAAAWAVAWVDAWEIDETDILSARMKAMQLAIDQLEPGADFALIDGNRDHGRSAAILTPHRCLVKGDSLSASIAAASILAKVSRDRWMVKAAEEYPEYQFQKHKGYGTKLHYELLRTYGPSPIHRRSFLKNLCAGRRAAAWGAGGRIWRPPFWRKRAVGSWTETGSAASGNWTWWRRAAAFSD